MHPPLDWIDEELARIEAQGLRRRLRTRAGPQAGRIVLDGRAVVNFGSNDYLGLASDPRLGALVADVLSREGWGSGASPLVCGRSQTHAELERRLAEFEHAESALVFSSGFAANMGTIAALAGPGDVIFGDRKNHASLWDGCRLSRADVRVYAHADPEDLEHRLCKAKQYRRRLIVTDGLFSMDGDLAPLKALVALAERFDAMLLVDEAHATGVLGAHGRGVTEHFGLEGRVPIRVGTLSKALGSLGGFVVGSRALVEWLVHRARPYVFSTAMPPAVAAAALAALDIVQQEPQRRQTLFARAAQLRHGLAEQGWSTGNSASQIIPVKVGSPERAVALSDELYRRGFFVPAIRPPSVPEGEACLRISLTAAHTPEMIDALTAALAELRSV